VNLRVLPQPANGAEWLWRCPRCEHKFALMLVDQKDTVDYGRLRTFRCKFCSEEVRFAERIPPQSV
jgi:hypothetical protein